MRYLLTLQQLDEKTNSQHRNQLVSTFSLTVCISTSSQVLC